MFCAEMDTTRLASPEDITENFSHGKYGPSKCTRLIKSACFKVWEVTTLGRNTKECS